MINQVFPLGVVAWGFLCLYGGGVGRHYVPQPKLVALLLFQHLFWKQSLSLHVWNATNLAHGERCYFFTWVPTEAWAPLLCTAFSEVKPQIKTSGNLIPIEWVRARAINWAHWTPGSCSQGQHHHATPLETWQVKRLLTRSQPISSVPHCAGMFRGLHSSCCWCLNLRRTFKIGFLCITVLAVLELAL